MRQAYAVFNVRYRLVVAV